MFAAIAAAFTIIFLALEVAHRIDWSWWVVFSPMLALAGLSLIAGIQMFQHQRKVAKHAKAAVDELMKSANQSANPFAAFSEALSKLGQGGGPPVA